MKPKTLLTSAAAFLLAAASLHADVRNGLVAYWPMNTATDDYPMTTPDVVGANDMVGPYKPSADVVAGGKYGNCVQFADSIADYLLFTNPPGADTGLPISKAGSWTIALWVKGDIQDASYYFTEGSGSSITPQTLLTAVNANNTSQVYIRDASGNNPVNFVTLTNATIDGTWHHVAMTYDTSSRAFRAYVDGNTNYATTFTPNYAANALYNSISLGARYRNATVDLPFAGSIDDVALWARALSRGEIQDVMTNSIATPVPAFVPTVTANPVGSTNLYPGDSITMSGAAYGTRPFYYQWLKNGTNVPGATASSLALTSVTANETGPYQLVITNSAGATTSLVAQVTVNTYASPNLANGMVAYWPLDAITGTKTPDLVSGYDLTLAGTVNPTLTSGKWGSAMSFDAANSQYARRIHTAGDALPIYRRTNFTVSVWIKVGIPAAFNWIFGEASTVSANPVFAFGQQTGATSDKLNTFVRTDSGSAVINNVASTNVIGDDVWHNVVWVQHDVGGTPKAQVYVDGSLSMNLTAAYGLTPNNTSIGGLNRATPNGFVTGLMDEVAIWERPLSPAEITLIQTSYITNPPVRLLPLAINSFKADLPAVAQGDSTVLRWDVSAGATSVSIDPLGTVTGQTVAGAGSTNVSPTSTTAYVLTVTRTTGIYGTETVKATNVVGVVPGVAANWHLLDNFDFYNPGNLNAGGYWIDVSQIPGGGSVAVVTNSCNRMAMPAGTASAAYLKLNTLTVNSNQSCTLFFRMIPKATDTATTRSCVGITDRPCNFDWQFKSGNIGPAVQALVNEVSPSQNPGDYQFAARDIPYSPLTLDPTVLQVDAVYNVWMDVTNVPIGDGSYPGQEDLFTVYIQKEGDAGRTCIFTNFTSDRDNGLLEAGTGGYPTDPLTRIYLWGNRSTLCALFDDFYLSKTGYNATVPRAAGYAGPAPTLQLQWTGSQWQILFQGKLLEATSINGAWSEVTGATSPYPVTTSGEKKFYRTVCN